MKFSEAIRIGSGKSQPVAGFVLKLNKSTGTVAACALGAAWLATHDYVPDVLLNVPGDLFKDYPCSRCEVAHPVTGEVWKMDLVIMDLMDSLDWTRERIAAWVERLGY